MLPSQLHALSAMSRYNFHCIVTQLGISPFPVFALFSLFSTYFFFSFQLLKNHPKNYYYHYFHFFSKPNKFIKIYFIHFFPVLHTVKKKKILNTFFFHLILDHFSKISQPPILTLTLVFNIFSYATRQAYKSYTQHITIHVIHTIHKSNTMHAVF